MIQCALTACVLMAKNSSNIRSVVIYMNFTLDIQQIAAHSFVLAISWRRMYPCRLKVLQMNEINLLLPCSTRIWMRLQVVAFLATASLTALSRCFWWVSIQYLHLNPYCLVTLTVYDPMLAVSPYGISTFEWCTARTALIPHECK